jgi:hypothetical protein
MARRLTYLDYGNTVETKEVLELLETVSSRLATDGFDNSDGNPRLMLWKDEPASNWRSYVGGQRKDRSYRI